MKSLVVRTVSFLLVLSLLALIPVFPVTSEATVDILPDAAPITESEIGSASIGSGFTGEWMVMKLRVNYCLREATRHSIYEKDGVAYGAPVQKDGEVLLPLTAVAAHMGYTVTPSADGSSITLTGDSTVGIVVGESRAAVNGSSVELTAPVGYLSSDAGESYPVLNMKDVEKLFDGWYVSYDTIGLIVICRSRNVFVVEDKNALVKELILSFVFDFPEGDKIYEDVKENTNNFDHPYLMATEDTWQRLKSIYQAEEGDPDYNERLKKTLQAYVTYSDGVCFKYERSADNADPDALQYGWNGFDQAKKPVNPYDHMGGYDSGGRLQELEEHSADLLNLSAAYRLTENPKYLQCGYGMMMALGEWQHWAPAQMLNTADSALEIALYYDWAYDGNVAMGYDVERMADIIYEKAIYWGLRVTNGQSAGSGHYYPVMTNNWNAACTAGMGIAALAILEFDQHAGDCAYLLSKNMYTLAKNGMDPYLDEGVYIEGAAYWGYATNAYYQYCSALDTAAGTNYGMMDLWGMDLTNYYACHTLSPDYVIYNYSDANTVKQGTYFFFYCAKAYKDPVLASVRMVHVNEGLNLNLWDLLNYPFDGVEEGAELPLDYAATSVGLYTARSRWESGAIYVGMMAGKNNTPHGHLDGGSFVYHNHKNIWITDLGSENYDVFGYWNDAYRYRYYRLNPEGHNTLCLVSDPTGVPLGQVLNSNCPTTSYYSNEYGSYITYDMTEAFGNNAVSWNRGMLFTNNRDTVVVQDEVQFNGPQTVYWFAHYLKENVYEIRISADGRTAYMIGWPDGKERVIRYSLVGSDGLRFTIMDCYTFVNVGQGGTYTPEQSTANAAGADHRYEDSRTGYAKLAIKGENILSFNVAVVIESVSLNREIEVGYKWHEMSDWTPTADIRTEYYEPPVIVPTRGEPKLSSISSSDRKLTKYIEDGTVFGKDFDNYYRALTDLKYAFDRIDGADEKYPEQYLRFLERELLYDAVAREMNKRREDIGELVRGIMPARFTRS